MLRFSRANTKLKKLHKVYRLRKYNGLSGKTIHSFDLLSAHSCPGAKDCKSKVVEENGVRKLIDGPDVKFRCFSASQEALLTGVYNLRKGNFEAVKKLSQSDLTEELLKAFPKKAGIVRFHVAGDIFNEKQMAAYIDLAKEKKDTLFYGYTKSLRIFVKHMDKIPSNFRMIASKGGRYDHLIEEYSLPFSQVVFSEKEAKGLGLPIDEDDSHAALGKSCALLIHGNGPQGSDQARQHSEKSRRGG